MNIFLPINPCHTYQAFNKTLYHGRMISTRKGNPTSNGTPADSACCHAIMCDLQLQAMGGHFSHFKTSLLVLIVVMQRYWSLAAIVFWIVIQCVKHYAHQIMPQCCRNIDIM